MRIPIKLDSICLQEALRYLGWKGECRDERVLAQLEHARCIALEGIRPLVVAQRFPLGEDGSFVNTTFTPQGEEPLHLLEGCKEGVLLAATLGALSEQLILREQARSASSALVLDAVLSAAIEAVCDRACLVLSKEASKEGLHLTWRFSPGYGDMPLAQTKEICAVLDAHKTIGLTVSASGLMIPRKSVTALMGLSQTKRSDHAQGCEGCARRATCAMRKDRG